MISMDGGLVFGISIIQMLINNSYHFNIQSPQNDIILVKKNLYM